MVIEALVTGRVVTIVCIAMYIHLAVLTSSTTSCEFSQSSGTVSASTDKTKRSINHSAIYHHGSREFSPGR